jgi:hypothetical protein
MTEEVAMSPLWIAAIICLVLLGSGVAAWLYTRRPNLGLNDRYSAQPLIVLEQEAMLKYLHTAFPGQVVVPNVPLSHMLSVRRADKRQRAEERLKDQKVDFVVCGENGTPLFAFDLEQYHLSDARNKAHQAKIKNRMLKTAGVRLVSVKANVDRMPSPDHFREQLNLAALPRNQLNRRATDGKPANPREELESHFSEFDPGFSSSYFRESEILGISRLAELDEMLDRPGSRRVRGDRNGPDSLQAGHSGFDGGTNDVRGG